MPVRGMKSGAPLAFAALAAGLLALAGGSAQQPPAGASASPTLRPIGVITQIQPGQFTLRTDAGPELTIHLPEGVSVLSVPPGAKDLKSATRIEVNAINMGDRVLVVGPLSADSKSVVAKTVIVMTKTALEQAHEAERLEWERRGIAGVVSAIDPAGREITIAVPNTPPTPGNPTHPVSITLGPNVSMLRYAPDSVKFSDAKPAQFSDVKVGDQVRALGDRSADGTHFTAEKMVFGTFRNIGATVISVDAAQGTLMVKDLASGKPLLVRTGPDSQLHRLPPFIANMIAMFNAGAEAGGGAPGQPGQGSGGAGRGAPGQSAGGSGGAAASAYHRNPGGPGGGFGGAPRDFNQMLARTPAFSLSELKPGEPLIVVSTEGAKPSEVNAIAVLAGVQPILEARPKGSKQLVLGPWNMSAGGGGDEIQ